MTNTEHNATDEYTCTECGHLGNGQVPGCTCIGCDDACGKRLVEWPYGNCTERSGHTGDCDRRQTTPRHSVPEAPHDETDMTNERACCGTPALAQVPHDELCDRHKRTIDTSEEVRDVDIIELTATWLGLPAHEQSAVQAWSGEDFGHRWTEAEAAELAEQWKQDLRDGMRD